MPSAAAQARVADWPALTPERLDQLAAILGLVRRPAAAA
jgi:hypothetical protein